MLGTGRLLAPRKRTRISDRFASLPVALTATTLGLAEIDVDGVMPAGTAGTVLIV